MGKKLYYLCLALLMLVGGCSMFPPLTLPDRGIDIEPYCCTPDEEFAHSCDGFRICELNSQEELI